MLDPVAVLDDLLSTRSDEVAATLQAACAAVRKAAPDACEHIFATYVVGSVFTFTGKLNGAFCHPVAYANHVNLGFNRGAEMHDPHGLLEGTGKLIRHIRIDSPAMLKKREVRDMIDQAVAIGMSLTERYGMAPRVVTDPGARANKKATKEKATQKKTTKKKTAKK